MNASKPIGSLSLDLDNKWSYMKTHGDPGWESFPSYLDILVPRVLKFLADRNLTITFFVVGQDAALARNHNALRAIAAAGHELGNHSFTHEPWLHLFSKERIEQEIAQTEEAIEALTASRPLGFRGPGFSFSDNTLRVLIERGYLYDASCLPTWIGPLARAYYFMTSKFGKDESKKRKALFGSVKDCLAPLGQHQLKCGSDQLLEIPVTTMPWFRIPIHASYILYLATFSRRLALFYFRFALALCRLTAVQPSLLLHPLDFLGCDDTSELAFFPAMKLGSEPKLRIMSEIVGIYCSTYSVLSMREHADRLLRKGELSSVNARQPRAVL
ncbi:MAG TPA: polysaccharide deacetylase family protein [Terriglobales bacterium]|nr:polysaccharide deacetylase family protein [Terriglobales bacterium]